MNNTTVSGPLVLIVDDDPRNLKLARDVLDAPYLPLIVQEAAGVPLDSSFAEQKRILQRCGGLFYGCADGAEARSFNRALIQAGKAFPWTSELLIHR